MNKILGKKLELMLEQLKHIEERHNSHVNYTTNRIEGISRRIEKLEDFVIENLSKKEVNK